MSIRHWFNTSHDINADPEVWELTDLHGDRALRIWLEILSIADRNDGSIPGWSGERFAEPSPQLRRSLAGRCRTTGETVRRACRFFDERLWTVPGTPHRVRNHAKYHRTRGPNQIPNEELTSAPPTVPILPTVPNPPKEETSSLVLSHSTRRKPAIPVHGEWPSVEALVTLYNEQSAEECPAVQQLSEARIKKARRYLGQFPAQDFWEQVMRQIRDSPFLRGLRNRNGHTSFIADFDWLLTNGKDGSENVVKVHDGKYLQEN